VFSEGHIRHLEMQAIFEERNQVFREEMTNLCQDQMKRKFSLTTMSTPNTETSPAQTCADDSTLEEQAEEARYGTVTTALPEVAFEQINKHEPPETP
jgi:hypothetical protein